MIPWSGFSVDRGVCFGPACYGPQTVAGPQDRQAAMFVFGSVFLWRCTGLAKVLRSHPKHANHSLKPALFYSNVPGCNSSLWKTAEATGECVHNIRYTHSSALCDQIWCECSSSKFKVGLATRTQLVSYMKGCIKQNMQAFWHYREHFYWQGHKSLHRRYDQPCSKSERSPFLNLNFSRNFKHTIWW